MEKLANLLIGILLYIIIYFFTGGFFPLFFNLVVFISGVPQVGLTDYGLGLMAFFAHLIFIVVTCIIIYLVEKKFENSKNAKRALSILAYAVVSSIFIDFFALILFSGAVY